jgi:hypothetical protein
MDLTDTLGKRSRWTRTPLGISHRLRERDLVWLEALHRHGPLPSSYIVAFTKSTHKSDKRQKERLSILFHEHANPHEQNYLDRPEQQQMSRGVDHSNVIYYPTQAGFTALKDAHRFTPHGAPSANPWHHGVMIACITASIELATIQTRNIRYIGREEILARANRSFSFPTTIRYGQKNITVNLLPDGIFGLEFMEGAKKYYRFYLLEADRATEPAEAGSYARKSVLRTILQHQQFVGKGLYKDALKLSAGLMSLHVTTSARRLQSIKDVAKKVSPQNNYLCFQAISGFGYYFEPPPPMHNLLTDPWERVGAEPFYINRILPK